MGSVFALERDQTTIRRRRPEASGPQSDAGPSHGLAVAVDGRLLTKALTIRKTEERLLDLFAQGKISGTVHTCIGQEWVGVAVAEHLQPGDYVFSNHRGHGHYIARTDDVEGLIAELMGRTIGVCGGRGGSQHLCRDGFFSNGIQGGTTPVAAGLAMAHTLADKDGISVVFIGDGTLGEGLVYETLNIASKWSLPLLIVLEDNGIAQSTDQRDSLAGSVAGRADAFNVHYADASTDDPAGLIEATGKAVARVRQQRVPAILHVQTRRLKSHSKGDDTRSPEHLAKLAAADTLNRITAGDSPAIKELTAAINRRLDQAVERASAAPTTSVAQVVDDSLPANADAPTWRPLAFDSKRANEATREALAAQMQRNERIILLGEDISDPYGGAFRVTAGLSDRFPGRVRNTPISEAAIVGIANGLALAGWQPVAEIMFGDFVLLAADQFINHAAKFAWMYNEQVRVPLIIRTPMGGYRGYGPTHSQSLEKHLLGVPGTRVLALTHRYCPGMLYDALLGNNDRPTLVIENKLLYSQRTDGTAPAGARLEVTDATFPTVRISPAGECQLTIVAYGGMVPLAESAMKTLRDEEDIDCELLIPTQLYPLDLSPILESTGRTGRLLVVEEGQGFAGFGSETIAQIATHSAKPLRCARVNALPCGIPAAKSAETDVLPNAAGIVDAARKLTLLE